MDSLEREIQELRALYWSDRDPDGRGFAPLADAYRRAGNLSDALELLHDGLERHPDFASGYVVAARIHLARDDADAAMASLEKVLSLDDENTEALAGLGDLHEERGSLDVALDLFRRLSLALPNDGDVLDRIRSLSDQLEAGGAGNGDRVDDSFESSPVAGDTAPPGGEDVGRVIELEPLDPTVSAVAEVEAMAMDGTDSNGELDAADWHLPDEDLPEGEVAEEELFTQTLGELYADQGLTQRAVEVYRHLIEADPDDPELRARLAELEGIPADALDIPDTSSEAEPVEHTEPVAASRTDLPDLDALAEDMATGPEDAAGLDTPFAWPETAEEVRSIDPGPPIGERLAALLAWTPSGVVPTSLPIEDLAPDAVAEEGSASESSASPVVPVESLAPEPPAPGEAPDRVAEFQDWMSRFKK